MKQTLTKLAYTDSSMISTQKRSQNMINLLYHGPISTKYRVFINWTTLSYCVQSCRLYLKGLNCTRTAFGNCIINRMDFQTLSIQKICSALPCITHPLKKTARKLKNYGFLHTPIGDLWHLFILNPPRASKSPWKANGNTCDIIQTGYLSTSGMQWNLRQEGCWRQPFIEFTNPHPTRGSTSPY